MKLNEIPAYIAFATLCCVVLLSSCATTDKVVSDIKAMSPAALQSKAQALTTAVFLVDNSASLRQALSVGVGVIQHYAISTAPSPSVLLSDLNAAITKAIPAQAPLVNAVVTPILYGLYQSEYAKLAGHNDQLIADLQAVAAGVNSGMAFVPAGVVLPIVKL